MIIRFRQSGGVSGTAKVAEVDSSQVPAEELQRLKALVSRAEATESKRTLSGRPDEEQYFIEIETSEVRHTILVSRSCVGGDLQPLVEYLAGIARFEKRTRRRKSAE